MFAQRFTAAVLAVLLVASGVGATATSSTGTEAYTGSHVSFDTKSNAVVDYRVGDTTVLESVAVQSQSEAQQSSGVDIGGDLSAVTGFTGADVAVASTTDTQATVETDSGATMRAHDNDHGILVVASGDESQYVTANVSSSASTEAASDDRVVVTTDDGTTGTFIVVGDGDVTVNDEGNVTASLDEDAKLVFRAYEADRTSADRKQERLIANGTAAAEVHVMQSAESGGETAVDVVQYGQDTSVEVTEQSEGTVTMTAERSEHEGRVIITSVSDAVIENTDDLQVTVDGEAAVRASSYSELQGATEGGDTSKFLVRQQSSAEASAEVLVAVNHFSERTVTMQSSDGAESGTDDGSSGTDDGTSGDESDDSGSGSDDESSVGAPGFGVGVSVLAFLSFALFARVRS